MNQAHFQACGAWTKIHLWPLIRSNCSIVFSYEEHHIQDSLQFDTLLLSCGFFLLSTNVKADRFWIHLKLWTGQGEALECCNVTCSTYWFRMCALLVRCVPNNPKSGTSQHVKLLPAKPKRQNLEHSELKSDVPLILSSPCHKPRVKRACNSNRVHTELKSKISFGLLQVLFRCTNTSVRMCRHSVFQLKCQGVELAFFFCFFPVSK